MSDATGAPIERIAMMANSKLRAFSEIYPVHQSSDTPQQDRERAYRNDLLAVVASHGALLASCEAMLRLESAIDESAWYASSEIPDAFRGLRIAVELRPRFVVFENVPGLLSSDDGRDFARVIRHLGDCGFHGGWRVLDAEGFGVAQHRRRVFGVFTRERSRIGCVAEILALRESLRWHPAESGKAGADAAADAGSGLEVRGVVNALTANGVGTKGAGDTQAQAGHFIPQKAAFGGNNTQGPRQVAAGLQSGGGTRGDFESETFIVEREGVKAFAANDYTTGSYRETRVAPPLTTGTDSTRGAPIAVRMAQTGANGIGIRRDSAHTLDGRPTAVAFTQNQREEVREFQTAAALPVEPGMHQQTFVNDGYSVRRLTPRECERLMGWPDDHTRYAADGREIADGPRYRMCGNGVVASVAEWIGRRLMSA